jgi:hypothetical protein
MVVHTYNPNTQKADAGGSEFQYSLGYLAGPYLKKTKTVPSRLMNQRSFLGLFFPPILITSPPGNPLFPGLLLLLFTSPLRGIRCQEGLSPALAPQYSPCSPVCLIYHMVSTIQPLLSLVLHLQCPFNIWKWLRSCCRHLHSHTLYTLMSSHLHSPAPCSPFACHPWSPGYGGSQAPPRQSAHQPYFIPCVAILHFRLSQCTFANPVSSQSE